MRKLLWAGGVAASVVALTIGGATAAAVTDEEPEAPDVPLAGAELADATRAALAHVGGGEVTDTEAGDDGASYEVEIRGPDGREVEVDLDRDFHVIGEELDDD